jgi:hypothetical protein
MARSVCRLYTVIAAAAVAALVLADANAQQAKDQGQAAKQSLAKHSSPAKAKGESKTETGSLAVPPRGGEANPGQGQLGDPRIFYYRQLALIHGHLLIGNDLVQEDRWDEALPHFVRPMEEIYPQIVPYLKTQSIPSFDAQLKTLAQSVKARKKEAYDAARLFVQMRMDRALDSARKFMTPMNPFTLKTIAEVLKVAQSEYAAAVEDGKIGKVAAYQDGRGFVYYAHQMFETIAPELETADRRSVDDMRWAFVELKTAWPRPMPPEHAAMTVQAVAVRIGRIEELAAKLQ